MSELWKQLQSDLTVNQIIFSSQGELFHVVRSTFNRQAIPHTTGYRVSAIQHVRLIIRHRGNLQTAIG